MLENSRKKKNPRSDFARERVEHWLSIGGRTAKEMADRSGIVATRISDLRKGGDMNRVNLEKLAKFLKISVEELLSPMEGGAEESPESGRVLTRDQERVLDFAEIVGFPTAIELLKRAAMPDDDRGRIITTRPAPKPKPKGKPKGKSTG